jgi:hypothetical protein
MEEELGERKRERKREEMKSASLCVRNIAVHL